MVQDCLRAEVLHRIHESHQGITKCRERAKGSVWWPGLNKTIKEMVDKCQFYMEYKPTNREQPLLPIELPEHPRQVLGIDLCELVRQQDKVMKDKYKAHYDRRHEVQTLKPLETSQPVRIKFIVTKHGTNWAKFWIIGPSSDNLSYLVHTEDGTFRRNCKHLNPDLVGNYLS